MQKTASPKTSWLDRPILQGVPVLTGEMLLFLLIVALAALSRLYGLGLRVMSHDESLHVYYSWLLSQGQGYQYDPMMHGPLQFHLVALTYFLFGASDFTARLPHAIASILTIVMLWKWRRLLGRAGTLVTAGLMLISPFMLYYGRYARNEAFVALFGVLTLYAILRYLETGRWRYLLLLAVATALQFITKETAFIYTAQALLFLAVYLINRVTRVPWRRTGLLNAFVIILSIAGMLLGATLGIAIYDRLQLSADASQTAAPIIPGETQAPATPAAVQLPSSTTLAVIAGLALLAAAVLLIVGYGWKNLRRERSFAMLILLATFVLPMLAPLPVVALGRNPIDYAVFVSPSWSVLPFLKDVLRIFDWKGVSDAVVTARFVMLFAILSITVGLLWNPRRWPLYAAVFWGIYLVFYTTFFTNPDGLAVGLVGSLGYWLQQQGVHRGSQPWYYYLLIQIPIYEFLPALGLGLAAYFGFRRKSPAPLLGGTGQDVPSEVPATRTKAEKSKGLAPSWDEGAGQDPGSSVPETAPVFPLLLWWSLSALLAYTLAGEKMPWLTVHITLPMILLTGWALGQLVERLDWTRVRERRGLLTGILLVLFFISLSAALAAGLGVNPPFQGKTLAELSATGSFLLWALTALASAGGIAYLTAEWKVRDTLRLAALSVFSLLALLTSRAAVRAAYVHYNDATEYLVYAHSAQGVRDVMDLLAKISDRTAGGHNLAVAYDDGGDTRGVAWPFTWYLRDYPNLTPFAAPSPDLRNIPFIIVDPQNYDAIQNVVGNDYYEIDLTRMVWPNQDYFGLNGPRIHNALTDPAMRTALLQIWLNRDYEPYRQATDESGLSVSTWQPSDGMKLYIRKDYAAKIWEFGIIQPAAVKADPYEQGKVTLAADQAVGTGGSGPGQFNAPHGLAVAPDGSVYVADTNNNRIQHFSSDGQLLGSWGTFADISAGPAPLGTLNQPWDLAVSPDGRWVYVADTWNDRVEKFNVDGTPVATWGSAVYDPHNNNLLGMWGPRGIAVDAEGRVFVADTGNKRILEYDADGNPITAIGSQGMDVGQLEEPVGIALDAQGNLYVADTWNQRVQVFASSDGGLTYQPSLQWDVAGWYSESLDNKPYLAVDGQGHVFLTDPEAFRVIEFTTAGQFIRTWGDYGADLGSFNLASGVGADGQGRIWVSDPVNNRLLRFTLP